MDRVNNKLIHLSLVGIGAEKVEDLDKVIVYPNLAREKVIFGNNLPLQIRIRTAILGEN
ncbi:MAG: hypothetical protein AB1567_05520 [bacterium]